jgi:hypothetical protein
MMGLLLAPWVVVFDDVGDSTNRCTYVLLESHHEVQFDNVASC